MRNRADVPGSREAVTTDSVGLGPPPAPSPPSGHRRRRGHLGPDQPAASGMSGVTAGFLRMVVTGLCVSFTPVDGSVGRSRDGERARTRYSIRPTTSGHGRPTTAG